MSSQSKENQLRRILYELQLMEGTAQALQQRHQFLSGAASELRLSQQSLNDMKELNPGTPLLVPIGGGAFIHAQTGDLSKVIIGIGADTSIEMDHPRALDDVNKRFEEVEKAINSVESQLSQILAQIQTHQEVANRLTAEIQGEAAGVR